MEVNNVNIGDFYVSAYTSLALKGICCIYLISTHWCTYNLHLIEDNLLTNFIPRHFGHFCIIVFMFLSGYGISVVEIKKQRTYKDYAKGRLWKILKPAWIVSSITLIVYILWGPREISMETVGEN